MAMNKAKKRSRDLALGKLKHYLKKAGLESPPTRIIAKMNCEELIVWGNKHLKPAKAMSAR